ncbi:MULTISPECIES: GNAT family N-acetyltransferase [unclassified Serratia (in: enterobacteria)]|uniref:GNAT family N-acetyltransferase n=1 Tax=unclassified Serratia (in: enterobacteria) TaxID=2647522 RepID=UPI000469428A|nr:MULTISPECIES: GNAT family N-acetyltransferase [unclassified Serratia (in: enterobacteria)]
MEPSQQWQRGEFRINSDKSELDLAFTHAFLATTRWAQGISLATVQQSIDNSLCFGLYHQHRQIGFARLVTDYATFGYLCDVFVMPKFARQGLAKWLMVCMLEHPVLQRLRRIMLVTSSAPGLYQQVGYQPVNKQDFVWQIARPDIYQQQ